MIGKTRVLVSGYGVITKTLLDRLSGSSPYEFVLLSRHKKDAPNERVGLLEANAEEFPDCEIVLGCFDSDRTSRRFWGDPRLRRMVASNRSSCIEMSTLSVGWAQEWHRFLGETGGSTTESPFTGSRPGAARGNLSLFVHQPGPDSRADEFLSHFSERRYPFSEAGSPMRFKLYYNAWGAVILHTASGFLTGLRQEMTNDWDVARDIVSNDGWMSLVCRSKLDRIEQRDYQDPDFTLANMCKDLVLAGQEAQGWLAQEIKFCTEAYQRAAQLVPGRVDFSAIAEVTKDA